MIKRLARRIQAGDTIVEVLIALSIVSIVLVGAFLVTNNSSKGVQDNQEHSQAQQLLQSQLEALRGYMQDSDATTAAAAFAGLPVQKCMGADNLPHGVNDCTPAAIGGDTDVRPTFTKDGNDYTFTVEWDSIKGGTAREQYVYRIYPKN